MNSANIKRRIKRKKEKQRRRVEIIQNVTLFTFCITLFCVGIVMGAMGVIRVCKRDYIPIEPEKVSNEVVTIENNFSGKSLCAGISAVDFENAEIIEVDEAETEVDVVEVETETEQSAPYSEEDLEYLAHCIYAEVGNLSEDAHFYCGSVILNRVASDDYPDTIKEVINQKGQYSTHKSMWNKEPDDMTWEIAEELLIYGSVAPADVIYQSMSEQGSAVFYSERGEYFCYK